MSMQQPEDVQRGEAGEKSVELFFIHLGWGPLPTGRQDLGTDLYVQVRDTQRIDLRTMIGVQVKTGDSWFAERAEVDGRRGWWFRERDKKHAEYWANHHIPHILVLQSDDDATRVWVALDAHTILDTGVGIKVFVPEDQKLEAAQSTRWVDMALEARRLVSFEGSRWTFSVTQIPVHDWPRYALLAPRLVAPHVNRGYSEPINWAEATALCIEAHPERWGHFAAKNDEVPSPSDALESGDPGWRFAAAVYKWVTEDGGGLESVVLDDAPTSIRAARAVCLAISHANNDRLDDALGALAREIDDERVTADQAWLRVHEARVLAESGRTDEAVQRLRDVNAVLAG